MAAKISGQTNNSASAAALAAAQAAAEAAREAAQRALELARQQALLAQQRAQALARSLFEKPQTTQKPVDLTGAPKPHTAQTLAQLRQGTSTQLTAISKDPKLTPAQRQAKAAQVIQQYFQSAKKDGFTYAPKPNGGTSLLDEAARDGGKYQVNLGSQGTYDCTEAAIEAQKMFAQAGVPSNLDVVRNPDGTRHALLSVGGQSFDATRALLGGQALGPQDTRPVLGSFSQSQVEQLFVHGGSDTSARLEAAQLHLSGADGIKANYVAGPGATGSSSPSDTVTSDTQALQQAHNDVKKYDQELGRELAALGPGLTAKQKQAFIDAYKKKVNADHGDVYAVEQADADILKADLQNPSTLAAAKDGSLSRQTLTQGLSALASSPDYAAARDFVANNVSSPTGALRGLYAGQGKELLDQVVAPALQRAMQDGVAAHGGDMSAAYADVSPAFKNIVSGLDFGAAGSATAVGVGKMFDSLDKFMQGSSKSLADFQQIAKEAEGLGKGFGLVAAGIAFAAGTADATSSAIQGQWMPAVSSVFGAASGGLDIFNNACELLAKQVGNAALREGAVGVLGAISSGISLVYDISTIAKGGGGNITNVTNTVGDILGVVGGVSQLIPGADVAGLVLIGIGALVKFGGQVAQDNQDAKLAQQQQDLQLKQNIVDLMTSSYWQGEGQPLGGSTDPGVQQQILNDFVNGIPNGLQSLGHAGLSAEELQAIATNPQDAGVFNADNAAMVDRFSGDFRLNSSQVFGLINQISQTPSKSGADPFDTFTQTVNTSITEQYERHNATQADYQFNNTPSSSGSPQELYPSSSNPDRDLLAAALGNYLVDGSGNPTFNYQLAGASDPGTLAGVKGYLQGIDPQNF